LRRPVRDYSRGMRQKIGIIQALQHDPELAILDEPTEGLDPLMQRAFYRILDDLRAAGRTIFFSSHVLSEVERVCDRVAIVRRGRAGRSDPMSRVLFGHLWRSQRTKLLIVSLALFGWSLFLPVIYQSFGSQMKALIDSGVIPKQFTNFGGGDVFSLGGSIALGYIHPIS